MLEIPPIDPVNHAVAFGYEWSDVFDQYFAIRMQELGIPDHLFGATDFDGDGQWKAFINHEREGGSITDGISVNSGVLNPELFSGKWSRIWVKARFRDRIDAVIAHEYEEDRTGSHEASLMVAPMTKLFISEQARLILKAMKR